MAQGKSNGFGFNLPGIFEFSHSKATLRVKEVLKEKATWLGTAGEYHTYFWVRMLPPALLSNRLDPDFRTMLDYTNGVFNADTKDTWYDIFDYFGSHYVAGFELGGMVESETKIHYDRLKNLDIDYLRTELSFSFGQVTTPVKLDIPFSVGSITDPANGATPNMDIPITNPGFDLSQYTEEDDTESNPDRGDSGAPTSAGFGAGLAQIPFGFSFYQAKLHYERKLDDQFKGSTDIKTYCSPACPNPQDWRDWVPTIIQNPQAITKVLEPITKVIKDNNIKAVFNQAFEAYKADWNAGNIPRNRGLPRTKLLHSLVMRRYGLEMLHRLGNGTQIWEHPTNERFRAAY